MLNIKKYIKKIDDILYSHFGKINVLFLVKNQFGWQCQKAIYESIINSNKNKSFTIATTVTSENNLPSRSDEANDYFYKNYIPLKKARWKKWHFIIRTDIDSLYFYRNTIKIMMPHGPSFGNSMSNYDETMYKSNCCDIYFGLSNSSWALIKKSIKESHEYLNKTFLTIGFPKSDVLFSPRCDTKLFPEFRNQIDSNKKTILIGSHWTETSILESLGIKFFKKLINEFSESYNFIVTGHELLWKTHEGDSKNISLWNELKTLENNYKNVVITRSILSMFSLIKSCDIFISDHSSFTIECSTQNLPVLFYDHPDRVFYSKEVLNIYRNSCYTFSNISNAITHLKTIQNRKDEKHAAREVMMNTFYSNRGHAADFAANTLIKLGRNLPYNKNKIDALLK